MVVICSIYRQYIETKAGEGHVGFSSYYMCFPVCSRGCGKGKWYKFNDTVIEEFDLNDETLEYECFGGEYRPKVYDQSKYLQVDVSH